MKKIYGIILIVSALVLFMAGCGSSGIGESGISKDEYSQIKMGLTRTEVEAIIRGDNGLDSCGEEISSTTNGTVTTSIYKYPGEKSGYAEISYEYDKSQGISAKENVSGKKDYKLK